MPTFPTQGETPWDAELKAYIDGGDGANAFVTSVVDAKQNLLVSDLGATFLNSAAETSMFAGSLITITGASLSAGDLIEVKAWGTYLNNSGAGRDVTIRGFLGATPIAAAASGIGTSITANGTVRPFHFESAIRIDVDGAAGSMTSVSTLRVGLPGGIGADPIVATAVASTVLDLTQNYTFDLKSTFSAATAIQIIDTYAVIVSRRLNG